MGVLLDFKKKDYTNTLKLDIIIIKNIREKGDNNPSNFDDKKDKKKIKVTKPNKYYNEREKLKL